MLKNWVILFFCLNVFTAPLQSKAQTDKIKLSSDQIIVNQSNFLSAKGNVGVGFDNYRINADELIFDQNIGEMKLRGISEFTDSVSLKMSASNAVFYPSAQIGTVYRAKINLDNSIRMHAEEVMVGKDGVESLTGITRVTSCKECKNKKLPWHLSASSAVRDTENLNVVYKDVKLHAKGLRIGYIPYLRLPDPKVKRAKGFLIPEAVLTSNLATGLKIPYFVPIGLSSDILITPYFSTKTRTLEYRYRKKFRNGGLTILGAFSDDDLVISDLRYFSQLVGNFQLGYGIDLNFDIGRVADTSYLRDYVYSDESGFNSQISLGKTIVEKQKFFDGGLGYLREKEQYNSLNEYYSLSGSYTKNIDTLNLPGKLRLSADLNSSVNVNDTNRFSRPPSSAQVGINYNQDNSLGPFKFSNELYGKYNSFVNSADAGTTNEEFSFQYGASTLISAPFYFRGRGKLSSFSPKFLIALNGQENDIVGDYFIGDEELTWGNIFSGKKIRSLTESEAGLSVALGVERRIFWDNGRHLGFSFAGSKIDNLTYTPNPNLGLESQDINYLGRVYYQTKHANTFSASALFSSRGHLLKGDLRGNYLYKKLNVGLNYETIDQNIDNRLSEDLRNLNLTSVYNLSDDFKLNAGGRYDLTIDQMAQSSFGLSFGWGSWEYNFTQDYLKQDPEKFSMSAIFEDECTRLTFSFENRYQGIGSSKPVKSLMFRVQLKPFANVVFSQGADQITF